MESKRKYHKLLVGTQTATRTLNIGMPSQVRHTLLYDLVILPSGIY